MIKERGYIVGIIETLVRQSGKPTGALGRVMVRIMNRVDSGLNNWVMEKTDFPMERVLEIGCGGGETLHVLQRNTKIDHVVGIDYSAVAVSVARERHLKSIEAGRSTIYEADVASLPFPQCHFDCVLAVRSHYFWEDLEKSFIEIFRTLKPNGQMLIFSEQAKIQYHMKDFQTDDSMRTLLLSVGFKNINIENRQSVQCITAYRK